jgi:glyoxylase-like metal-dependent hydrolase (beta-lactamase superfamily II)
VAALRALLDAGEPVVVLDVRRDEDRAEWAIPGSIHTNAYDALKAGDPAALRRFKAPAGVPVVTVCAAGQTSLTAADQLRARGIEARSLTGGMKAWSLAWNAAEVRLPTTDARVIQLRRTGKGCLSYLIGSGTEAAVIDPSLDPNVYIDLAAEQGWAITKILETHLHADHLMRSRLLAELTAAALHLPVTDRVAFSFSPLHDGEMVTVGVATLRAIGTPGHTPESTSYLLNGEVLFTGDTLFLTGVGRPDLEADREEARHRAHHLYSSLQRLLDLPAATVVLPGHTSEPVAFDRKPLLATLAAVREQTRLLNVDEAVFVEELLARIPATPPNHHQIVALNEAGQWPGGDPTDLEAGANRCAVS